MENPLRLWRTTNGKTQTHVARTINAATAISISEWERGTYKPSRKYLQAIAEMMGVSLEALTLDWDAWHEWRSTERAPRGRAAARTSRSSTRPTASGVKSA